MLGASAEWVVVRENVLARASDVDACRYPGLDPSAYTGARIHFVKLPAAAVRGGLFEPDWPAEAMPLYDPASAGSGCTGDSEARRRWEAVFQRARGLGIGLRATPRAPQVLGPALPAAACALAARRAAATSRCVAEFTRAVDGQRVRIVVAVIAVPEAPDPQRCQFVGHRVAVAVRVAGLDFGTIGAAAPGGFATHYDCRAQAVEPLRLYEFDGRAVLLGGFRGASIADRRTYPFLVVFPTRQAP